MQDRPALSKSTRLLSMSMPVTGNRRRSESERQRQAGVAEPEHADARGSCRNLGFKLQIRVSRGMDIVLDNCVHVFFNLQLPIPP